MLVDNQVGAAQRAVARINAGASVDLDTAMRAAFQGERTADAENWSRDRRGPRRAPIRRGRAQSAVSTVSGVSSDADPLAGEHSSSTTGIPFWLLQATDMVASALSADAQGLVMNAETSGDMLACVQH